MEITYVDIIYVELLTLMMMKMEKFCYIPQSLAIHPGCYKTIKAKLCSRV